MERCFLTLYDLALERLVFLGLVLSPALSLVALNHVLYTKALWELLILIMGSVIALLLALWNLRYLGRILRSTSDEYPGR
jgi:hypothetical protein